MNKEVKTPTVTIITACLNNRDTIEDTFISVLSQTHRFIEYIIIDGESTDGTINLIDAYKTKFDSDLINFKFIKEKDGGIAEAWNKGLGHANGDIIFFLNSDDWIPEKTVEKAVKTLNIDKLEIAYGICNRVDENKSLISSFKKKFFKYRVLINFGFSFTTCFVTKKVYEKVGGFNNSYKIAIDSHFLLRCVNAGVKFKTNSHEVFMRIGGVSTKFRLKAHKEYKKALLENGYPKLLVELSYLLFKRT
jgi:glycosyltransferase involved in cell wall biosynthesis